MFIPLVGVVAAVTTPRREAGSAGDGAAIFSNVCKPGLNGIVLETPRVSVSIGPEQDLAQGEEFKGPGSFEKESEGEPATW
jgi:hypothetical protein